MKNNLNISNKMELFSLLYSWGIEEVGIKGVIFNPTDLADFPLISDLGAENDKHFAQICGVIEDWPIVNCIIT